MKLLKQLNTTQRSLVLCGKHNHPNVNKIFRRRVLIIKKTGNNNREPKTPLKAIRRKCLSCCCGSASEVGKCEVVEMSSLDPQVWPAPCNGTEKGQGCGRE